MNIGRYLLPGERRIVSVRRHPAMLGKSAGVALLGVIATGIIGAHVPPAVTRVLWLGALVLIGRLLWQGLEWNVDRFIVTDQRVVLITGVSTRKIAMLPLRRVTDMTYQRSPLGRVFGYGEFLMESAGERQGLRRVTFVPRPDVLYLQISDLLFGQSRLGTGPGDGT